MIIINGFWCDRRIIVREIVSLTNVKTNKTFHIGCDFDSYFSSFGYSFFPKHSEHNEQTQFLVAKKIAAVLFVSLYFASFYVRSFYFCIQIRESWMSVAHVNFAQFVGNLPKVYTWRSTSTQVVFFSHQKLFITHRRCLCEKLRKKIPHKARMMSLYLEVRMIDIISFRRYGGVCHKPCDVIKRKTPVHVLSDLSEESDIHAEYVRCWSVHLPKRTNQKQNRISTGNAHC